jgi:hypothetical protein
VIETVLSRLRGAHPDMETIFMHGSCFELYGVMRAIWPDSEPWYQPIEGHVYTKVGSHLYDIRGKHRRTTVGMFDLRKPFSSDMPHRWSKRTHYRIQNQSKSLEAAA